MTAAVSQTPWPIRGISYFLAHPGLWLRPLLGTTVAYSITLSLLVVTSWLLWPAEQAESGFFLALWGYLQALAGGAIVALVSWLILLPLIMSFAYEKMVTHILKKHEVELDSETMLGSVISSAHMLVRTMHWRLLWPGLSILCFFAFPPAGALVSQLGLAHIACIDGCDLTLALRGVPGKQRPAIIKEHRWQLAVGIGMAALIGIALGVTIVGWVLFMPMMFTGTALIVAQWYLPPIEDAVDE